jgi:hypothetical protein
MPTLYWLVDPELVRQVSRLEAAGAVKRIEASVAKDELVESHQDYAILRDGLIPGDHTGPRPAGGVGGTRQGVKCLHAHLAWYLVGGKDPAGRLVAEMLGVSRSDFTVEPLLACFSQVGTANQVMEGRPVMVHAGMDQLGMDQLGMDRAESGLARQ